MRNMAGRGIGKRVKSLHNMEYDEVSLVDIPANQYSAVMIAKRHQGDEMPAENEIEIFDQEGTPLTEGDLETGDIVYDADGQAYEYTAPEVEDAPDEERELAYAGSGVAKRGSSALLGMRRPNVAKRSTTGASLADEVREALSKAATEQDRDAIIAKALEAVDEADARSQRAEEIAKAERDRRLEGEYVEVAKNLGLPVDPDEFGPVLKRCAELLPREDVEVLAKALEATSGVLYEEFGYQGVQDQGATDISDAEAYAESRVAKGGAEQVSKAAAVAEYYAEHPEAYEEYMANRGQ